MVRHSSKHNKKSGRASRRTSPLPLSHFSDDLEHPPEERTSELVMGKFTPKQVLFTLEKSGLLDCLRAQGFETFKLLIRSRDPFQHYLALYDKEELPDRLLGELLLRQTFFRAQAPFFPPIHQKNLPVLQIEWLLLQNPRAKFTPQRPRLPGQLHPGSGTGRIAVQLLLMLARYLDMSAIVNVPEYFHNAQLYARLFRFFDPHLEGRRQAIERDLLTNHPLARVSWAIERDCVLENDRPFQWFTAPQFIALSRMFREYFRCGEYRRRVNAAKEFYHYQLDLDCWEQKAPDLASV